MSSEAIQLVEDGFLAFAWENLSSRDRIKVMGDAPKTVWIFGAGASHHYALNLRGVPIPLASGFFEAFNSLPTSEGFHAHVGPLISFLYHSRGIRPEKVSEWTENIEEFMTSIELEVNKLRSKKNNNQKLDERELKKAILLAQAFNNMTFIFANVINEAQNGPSNSAYHYLLRSCGPNDTFITFNWDTLLDRALADAGCWTPNDGYGISFSSAFDGTWKPLVESSIVSSTNWKLLKLHGSTNWLVPYTGLDYQSFDYQAFVRETEKIFLFWQSSLPYETYQGRWRGGYAATCYGYYPPNLPTSVFSSESISAPPGHLLLRVTPLRIFSPFEEPQGDGIESSPLLIIPVRQKRYDTYKSTIESLWQQSKDAISNADKVVVVGYSFPPTDTRPLELLKNALDSAEGFSIEIVDPYAENIATRIGSDLLSKAKQVTIHAVTFEKYLEILWKEFPILMKKAADKHKEVRDWLDRIRGLGQLSSQFGKIFE